MRKTMWVTLMFLGMAVSVVAMEPLIPSDLPQKPTLIVRWADNGEHLEAVIDPSLSNNVRSYCQDTTCTGSDGDGRQIGDWDIVSVVFAGVTVDFNGWPVVIPLNSWARSGELQLNTTEGLEPINLQQWCSGSWKQWNCFFVNNQGQRARMQFDFSGPGLLTHVTWVTSYIEATPVATSTVTSTIVAVESTSTPTAVAATPTVTATVTSTAINTATSVPADSATPTATATATGTATSSPTVVNTATATETPPTRLEGDLNGDGKVDQKDQILFLLNWHKDRDTP